MTQNELKKLVEINYETECIIVGDDAVDTAIERFLKNQEIDFQVERGGENFDTLEILKIIVEGLSIIKFAIEIYQKMKASKKEVNAKELENEVKKQLAERVEIKDEQHNIPEIVEKVIEQEKSK